MIREGRCFVTDLALAAPLGDMRPIDGPGFSAAPLPFGTVVEVRCLLPVAPGIAGLLPMQANHCRDDGAWRYIWSRPDAWLLCHDEPDAVPDPAFAAAQDEGTCGIIDVSHAWAVFRLAGGAVRDVLATGTPLDLRAAMFPSGRSARTICAGFSILLDHRDAHVRVFVDASFGAAFRAWLEAAVQS